MDIISTALMMILTPLTMRWDKVLITAPVQTMVSARIKYRRFQPDSSTVALIVQDLIKPPACFVSVTLRTSSCCAYCRVSTSSMPSV
ncbi:hypothetical protein PoB_003225200 [Plakobranchus ocellatus]|uniref:Secreted protein n=1 Tax=Plakobranchus ocellatus TaxID=259542 RepID=A0AAV4AFE3_9GAST|nr:hypothetical protein PoB_003225200 [Plakobranchus ocellatus]